MHLLFLGPKASAASCACFTICLSDRSQISLLACEQLGWANQHSTLCLLQHGHRHMGPAGTASLTPYGQSPFCVL